jgi:hypothetical protein
MPNVNVSSVEVINADGLDVVGPSGTTITKFGTAEISKTESPIGTSTSVFFNGAGNSLTAPTDAGYDFGSGDFTIECWVYQQSTAVTTLISKGTFGPFEITLGANPIARVSTDGSTWVVTVTGVTAPATSWFHLAFIRSGNTLNLYINGVGVTPVAFTGSLVVNATDLLIGDSFVGYLGSLRITKGVARYTGNFTPERALFSEIPVDPLFSNVSLLLPANGTNGSSANGYFR